MFFPSCANGNLDSTVIENVVLPVFVSYKETDGGKLITLSTATEGARIYYTLDNTTPTTASALYSSPFTVTDCVVIKAFAVKEGLVNSPVNSVEIGEYTETKAPMGTVISNHLSVNGIVYEHTGEVVVSPYAAGKRTFNYADESCYPYIDTEWYTTCLKKAAFWKGVSSEVNPFIMGQYEVTRALFKGVMGGDPSYFQGEQKLGVLINGEYTDKYFDFDAYNAGGEGDLPVESVSVFMIMAFCNKLSLSKGYDIVYSYKKDGVELDWNSLNLSNISSIKESDYTRSIDITKNGYRIPTLAERELAARGGDENSPVWKYAFSGVDSTRKIYITEDELNALSEEEKQLYSNYILKTDENLDQIAWNKNTSKVQITSTDNKGILETGYPKKVGLKKPNTLNLYDMCGNVSEIVFDLTSDGYTAYSAGGSFDMNSKIFNYAIGYTSGSNKNKYTGFRLCRTIVAE